MVNGKEFTPIFIVGAARSGTTVLGKLISSHELVFEYSAETLLMEVSRIKYGNIFRSRSKRDAFLTDWFQSRQFKRSGLSRVEFENLLYGRKSYAELLIQFLKKMAFKEGQSLIVDSTPSNIYHYNKIIGACQNAKFIRIVRDGRDVAISQAKLGWSNPPPPFRDRLSSMHYSLHAWKFSNCMFDKFENSDNVITVYFEDLIDNPDFVLKKIGQFIDLDFSDIDISLVLKKNNNSAFRSTENASPIERWREESPGTILNISFMMNDYLGIHNYVRQKNMFGTKYLFRYFYFYIFLRFKRFLSRFHAIGKHSSQEIEVGKE